ncbi:MAG: hypothetical protein WB799_10330, partial [Candidatus Sulfotelmatobacter sp.]
RPVMKKISTAAEHKIENVEGQKLTSGLDLGDRSSWYCVLNETGEVLLERRLATTPQAIREVFGGMPGGPDCTGNWNALALGEPAVE